MYSTLTLSYAAACLVLIPLVLGLTVVTSLLMWHDAKRRRSFFALWAALCMFAFALKFHDSYVGLPLVLQALGY